MPYIKETSIRRTQDAADIVQIIESYGVKLRRVGGNYTGLCPFHREKTPSFSVNPQGQYFKCFGCGAAGGVIKFVELIERLDFAEALTNLAQRVGVELEYEKSAYGTRSPHVNIAASGDHKKALYWANKTALNYFRRALADSPADAYLRGRGFTTDTLNAWQLGWAPDDFHGLLDFIRDELTRQNAGAKFDQAVKFAAEAGVLRRHEEKQNYYDAFRGRVIFPIFDARQQPVGFGGRVLEEKPEQGGKYLNTAETPLFKKGRLLFGLNFAAREIGERREAIIVEGYTDTIMCHQYGVRNVVATLGTALTPDHVRLLRRHIGQDGKVVALFDADAAGKKATARAREIFMQEDAPLWILPDLAVKDAAEFLPKFGAEKFREFLNSAQEAFACLLQENLGQNFGNDLSAKTAAVMNVMRVVNLCPNAIRRQMMRQQVALLAAVDENLLPQPEGIGHREEGKGKREEGRGKREESSDALSPYSLSPNPSSLVPKMAGRQKAEKTLLRCMLVLPEWSERIVDLYPPDDWHFPDLAAAAGIIREAWAAGRPDLATLTAATTNEEVRGALLGLLDPAPPPTADEMNFILARGENETWTKKKQRLQEEIRRAALNKNEAELATLHAALRDQQARGRGK